MKGTGRIKMRNKKAKDFNVGYSSLILFGEHAVVYDRPAIATALNLKMTAEIIESPPYSEVVTWDGRKDMIDLINSQEGNMLERVVLVLKRKLGIEGKISYCLHSEIPMGSGLGSSAAIGVSMAKAMSQHFHLGLSKKDICAVAYEVEKLMHETASGIDNTVSTYGGILWYERGKEPISLSLKKPLYLLVSNSGVQKRTKEAIAIVKSLEASKTQRIFNQIESVVYSSKGSIEKGNIGKLGHLMNVNHELLKQLGVSHPVIERIREISLKDGAIGAKLTGGGLGGCVISLTTNMESQDRICGGLIRAGYPTIKQKIGPISE